MHAYGYISCIPVLNKIALGTRQDMAIMYPGQCKTTQVNENVTVSFSSNNSATNNIHIVLQKKTDNSTCVDNDCLIVIFDLQYIIRLETIDGTAEAHSDYVPLKTTVTFAVNETLREVHVQIVDDDIWEPDEFFFAKLFMDHEGATTGNHHVALGSVSINQITIINDDGMSRGRGDTRRGLVY